jgi:TadE-like protein
MPWLPARRSLHESQRGAAAVEFALVLFPLLMLLVGIVEFGRVYSEKLRMEHSVREAARVIALEYDDPGMNSVLLTAKAEVILTDLLSVDALADLSAHNIVLCTTDVSSPPDAIVEIHQSMELAIPMPSGGPFGPVSVAAKAQMRCEG